MGVDWLIMILETAKEAEEAGEIEKEVEARTGAARYEVRRDGGYLNRGWRIENISIEWGSSGCPSQSLTMDDPGMSSLPRSGRARDARGRAG